MSGHQIIYPSPGVAAPAPSMAPLLAAQKQQIQSSAPTGVIVSDPGDLRTHGVKSENDRDMDGICGFMNWALVGRMATEAALMTGVLFVTSVLRVLFPQYGFLSNIVVGFALMATVFTPVFLFSKITGTSLSLPGSVVITLSNWVLRAIKRCYPKSDKHSAEEHELSGKSYWYDIARGLCLIAAQILGAYIGVLLAVTPFLQGSAFALPPPSTSTVPELYYIANLMTPKFGLASWVLSGPVAVTAWQASAFNFIGSFIIHAAMIYAYAIRSLQVNSMFSGVLRGGSYMLSFFLFYSVTGAAFDWLMWFVPASINLSSGYFLDVYTNVDPANNVTALTDQCYAYLLAPLAGGVAAVLFIWLWAIITLATDLEADVLENDEHKSGKIMSPAAIARKLDPLQHLVIGQGMGNAATVRQRQGMY